MFEGKPIIGVAGGIGAGKSHLARLLERAGCCRVASDEMVAAAYTHPAVKRAVIERFGEGVLDPAGRVDRRAVGHVVFRDAGERIWLEKLLHPVANQVRLQVMNAAAGQDKVRAFVWDSPLLFETKLNELCDAVVFVDAPREDRLERVAQRGWDEAELSRRENVQMPLDSKRDAADYRVCNGSADPVTPGRAAGLLAAILAGCGDSVVPPLPSGVFRRERAGTPSGPSGGCDRCGCGDVAEPRAVAAT